LPSDKGFLPSGFFFSEALCLAEEHADALATKLELSEKAREKAEKDAAAVEGLRQRLQTTIRHARWPRKSSVKTP
jgi:hypothetical protein